MQNTYLSTFQSLGGIALLLGTAGLAVVLLENVWERRGDLSLMRTLGSSQAAIAGMVLSENAALLIAGMFSACFSALVAVSPAIATQPTAVRWCSLARLLRRFS
ncbi:MAG: FtsX-like permease family protein [Planctomycetota bacterium]